MQRWNPKLKRRGMLLFLLATGAAPLAGIANGAVMYGNFAGTDVSYQNVTETPTQLPGPTPAQLFGTPVVSGNSLLFTPSTFSVNGSGGSLEMQDSHLITNILSTDKSYPKTVTLLEGGAFTVGGGTVATTAMETLAITLCLSPA